jgi:hypothetical protein
VAIVKATYTKSRAIIKAAIRYIEHRSGENGAKITRTLFSYDGEITRGQAYSMIDTTPTGKHLYRLVLSPDPKREDTGRDLPLWELTTKTILELEERLHQAIPFVAAEHNDHTDIRHVHVIAPISGKLTRQDLQYLRDRATAVSLFQRRGHFITHFSPRDELRRAWENG